MKHFGLIVKWETQEFLNKQAIERVGDPELRKGSFCYKNPEGEIHRYLITVKKGQIVSYLEEVMDEEEIEFWEEEKVYIYQNQQAKLQGCIVFWNKRKMEI